MESPTAVIPAPAPPPAEPAGSKMRRSLAERGVIMMKEHRTIAEVPTLYGPPLEVIAQILVFVRGSERELTVGVKLERGETDRHLASSAFLDSDEIDEFLEAIDFIATTAGHMAHDRRDYTEVSYSSKDDVKIGFYQDGLEQKAFMSLGATGSSIFFTLATAQRIRAAISDARAHVDTRKLDWEAR